MRVLQGGEVVAELTDVERCGDRLVAVWHGRPPRFAPSEQLEPLSLESDDGFRREEGFWLYRIWDLGEQEAKVEIGGEQGAPPWRRSARAADEGPAESTEREHEREQAAGPRVAPARRPRVLVVDDDLDTLDTVAESLAIEGWDVMRASSGMEALRIARSESPDVAVVDLIMPEMSGQEVCAAIRREPTLAATRVLVVSAAEDTRMVAAECDADGAITKPFTLALLLREIRRLLGT